MAERSDRSRDDRSNRVHKKGAPDRSNLQDAKLEILLGTASSETQATSTIPLPETQLTHHPKAADTSNLISEEMIEKVVEHLKDNPDAVPGELLQILGEHLVLDMANEASIRGRSELDELIAKNPEKFLFLNTWIDTIGQKFGKRWVPDKGINQAILEHKLEQVKARNRPLHRRLIDAVRNTEPTISTSITERVEALHAQRIALEGQITVLRAESEALRRKMQQDEGALTVRLAEANAKFIQEQSILRRQMDADIERERAERGAARNQHEDKLADILAKIAQAQARLDQLTGAESQLGVEHQTRMGRLEAEYEQKRLELETDYQRRIATLETQIRSLTSERDIARLENGHRVDPQEDLRRDIESALSSATFVTRFATIQSSRGKETWDKLKHMADLIVKLSEIEKTYGTKERIQAGEQVQLHILGKGYLPGSWHTFYEAMTDQTLLALAEEVVKIRMEWGDGGKYDVEYSLNKESRIEKQRVLFEDLLLPKNK
jgi:hypothetical protein